MKTVLKRELFGKRLHSGDSRPANQAMANRTRIRILFGFMAVLGSLVALVWVLSRRSRLDSAKLTQTEISSTVSPTKPATPAQPSPTIQFTAEPTPMPTPTSSATEQPAPQASPATTELLIPVAGVRPEQLRDTFQEARAEGRTHDAIDIPAPRGTPVLAAADGRIVKLFQSKPGGTTLYQLGTDNKTVFYYAHLDHYADGIIEGRTVRRGDVIAYVGDTGNAGAGNYHLHFSILIVQDPKRYWEGTNINPYPLLRGGR
jgi:murein DD-endopeptidase MepM/ murein hydrolase activator NlpD